MFKIEYIAINPNSPEELQKISTDLVAYVVERSSKKVIRVNVITRRALADWYEDIVKKYSPKDFIFCLGSVCLLGHIMDMKLVEHSEADDESDDGTGGKKKKGKSNFDYHVN